MILLVALELIASQSNQGIRQLASLLNSTNRHVFRWVHF